MDKTILAAFRQGDQKTEMLIALAAIASTFLLRALTMAPIDDMGDSIFYWEAAKKIYYGLPYAPLNHWKARPGIVFPAAMSLHLLGPGPAAYYLPTVLASCMCSLFLYLLVRKTSTRAVALLAVGLFQLYPQMIRNGSQLLLEIYSATYVLVCLWFLVRYFEHQRPDRLALSCAALFLFIAYLTKITNLYFLPGILLAMLFQKRHWKELMFFCSLLLALFMIETLVYVFYFDEALGRLGIIVRSHVVGNESLRAISFWQLLYRHVRPGPHYTVLFVLYLYACWVIVRRRQGIMQSMAIISLSFFLLLTFAVKSLWPLKQLENNQIRYLLVGQPLMFFIVSQYYYTLMVKKISPRLINGILAMTLIAALAGYAILFRNNIPEHEIFRTRKLYATINTALSSQQPLFFTLKDSKDWHEMNSITGQSRQTISDQEIAPDHENAVAEHRLLRSRCTVINKNINLIRSAYTDGLYTRDELIVSIDFRGKQILALMAHGSEDPRPVLTGILNNDMQTIALITIRPLDIRTMTVRDYLSMDKKPEGLPGLNHHRE